MRGVIHTCVTSVNTNPTYLVKNRFGVYYFQRRIPLNGPKRYPSLTKLVRLSLRTKSKKEALRLVRLLLVMWESNSRAKKYFQNEDDYDDAMVLFQKFNQLKKLSFEDVQGQLLDSMDEWQDYLLNQATDYVESKALENGDHALLEEAQRVQNLQAQNYLINKNISINSIAIDEAFDDFINQCKNSWKKIVQ